MSHNDTKTASEKREHHEVRVEIRELSDEDQVNRRQAVDRLDPGGSG